MASSNHQIFREDAYKRYLQRQEQGVILRLVAPPTWIFAWLLLLLFLGAALLAWIVRVPTFMTGQGILIEQEASGEEGHHVVAVLFLTPNQQVYMRPGQPVELRVGPTATLLHGVVDHVDTHVESPLVIRARFNLQGENSQLVTGPSTTVRVRIEATDTINLYVGSAFSARIQVGSRSVLSLLPGFGQLLS